MSEATEQRAKQEQVAKELALKLAEEPCGHLSSPSQRKNAIEYYTTKFEPLLAAALAACAREEGRWWYERIDENTSHDEVIQKRIAALERAVGESK